MRSPPPPIRSALALWSRRLALVSALVSLAAVAAVQINRISPAEAVVVLGGGYLAGVIALCLGGAAMASIWKHGLLGLSAAFAGMLIALVTLAYPTFLLGKSLLLPQINDISTDVVTVPVIPAQPDAAYPAYFAGEQRAAYPGVQPLLVDVGTAEAYQLVAEALKTSGVEITDETPPLATGMADVVVAGIGVSLILRFVDDVVVRIRPSGADESRIDIRSHSRIGRHDIGVNAERVQAIAEEITRLAATAE